MPVSRETLVDRFWGGSEAEDVSAPLRQCLQSMRNAFKSDCLISSRQDVQIAPGWFTTDLDRIFTAYRRALAASSVAERLHWLMEAEQEIRGEFFAGWTPHSDEARIWLILARADVRGRLLPLLMLLAQTLQTVGNLNAAFDIARRALLFQPGHSPARELAWELAVATGQQDVIYALEQVQSFRDAVERFPRQGLNAVTFPEARFFQALFEAELATQAPALQKALLRLSVFPSPFPVEMAEAICGVPHSVLQSLAKTPFVQQATDTFCLTPLVRDCAWKRLATTTQRQLRRRLARFCIQTMTTSTAPVNVLPAPLEPAALGRPFLQMTLEWVQEQPPAIAYVRLINMLRHCGLNDLALQGIPYLKKIETDPSFSVEMRLEAGASAAYILMQADENAAAIGPLEAGVSLAAVVGAQNWLVNFYPTLMRAYSNLGDWEAARQAGLRAVEICRLVGHRQGEAHSIRVLAEIALHADEPEQALLLCEAAQEFSLRLPAESDCLPDALYWKARILSRLRRWNEALDAIEAALSFWQEAGDTKIGLCLCVLGQIRMELGQYAEARLHLEHAIDFHRRSAREGHRLAALEALGDVFCATGRYSQGHIRYEECYAYYRTKGHLATIERLLRKLQNSIQP